MLKKTNSSQDTFIMQSMNQLVPSDHILRKVDKYIDFDFIYDIVKDLYSDVGRASIDPVVLFKLVLIQNMFGIKSMRQTIKDCEVNIAYRWFLGLGFDSKIPHFTTFGKNYSRRFAGTDVFEQIFYNILNQAVKHNLVGGEIFYTDSTHIKANANISKYENEINEVVINTNAELINEINKERAKLNKKPLKINNNVKTVQKNRKVSTTDRDSGYMHRDRKQKGFMYLDHRTVDDKHNIIVHSKVTPGNVHDSKPYIEIIKYINIKTGMKPSAVALDSGYDTRAIHEFLELNNIFGVVAHRRYPRNKTQKHKYFFKYDSEHDLYECPNKQILKPINVTRDGYKVYRNKKECSTCPLKDECLGNSKKEYRDITRHIHDDIKDRARERRLSEFGKKIGKRRSQTVERSFADAKQNHGYRFARRKGLIKNQDDSWLLCATQNIKKIALMLSREELNIKNSTALSKIIDKFTKIKFIGHEKRPIDFILSSV